MQVGSKAWCQYWVQFYANRAERLMHRPGELDELTIVMAMEAQLLSFMWADHEPWA